MSLGKGDPEKNFESMEMLARGQKGEQGTQGERGERGLSRRVAKAIVVLCGIPLILALFAIFWINHEINGNNQKFCAVITAIVPVTRPADPKSNPSRVTAYEQYERFARLGRSLGC
jgi:uncharacterized membrane protein